MTHLTWVIGAGGLLGGAVSSAVARRPASRLVPGPPLPWSNDGAFAGAAEATADRFLAELRPGDDWAVVWAAGAAVTSSTAEALDRELDQFTLVLDAIGRVAERRGCASTGAVFYASSAGGVYGGSAHPPFDEDTVPVPLGGYGRFKLAAEERLFDFSEATGVSVLAGRIANLYGPGQKLHKMQGLISHLAKAQFSPAPASIFVPLDTIRDYIFITDCAELVLDTIDRLLAESAMRGRVRVVKNIASGQAVTISNLLGHLRSLAKGHPHVMLGSSAEASLQGLDLRVTSTVWTELDRRDLTPLPAGIKATMDDVLVHILAGRA